MALGQAGNRDFRPVRAKPKRSRPKPTPQPRKPPSPVRVVTAVARSQRPAPIAQPRRGSTPQPVRVITKQARAQRPARFTPRDTTPVARAHAQEAQYVSQGKAVEKAAKGQRRTDYSDLPVATRRATVRKAWATPKPQRTPEQKAAIQVHHERHAGDVAQRKLGGLARVAHAQEAAYVSQGEAVAKDAAEKSKKKKETYVLPKKVEALGVNIPLRDVEKAVTTGVRTVGKGIHAVGAAESKYLGSKGAPKILANAPKDAAEIAVTTPTSVVKLGQTAVTKPEKVPGMLAQPYKDLYHHPGKFITEHPVSSALMFAPTVRVPGRLAGRGARLVGKQTLERPSAHFPGTNLREKRYGSKDITVRAVQSKIDKRRAKKGTSVTHEPHPDAPKPGSPEFSDAVKKVNRVENLRTRGATAGERGAAEEAQKRVLNRHKLHVDDKGAVKPRTVTVERPGGGRPVMSQKHVERRVDEFFDVARREADERLARHTQEARDAGHTGEELEHKVKAIRKQVGVRTRRDFAREFGGETHPTTKAAKEAEANLPFDGTVMSVGAKEHTVVPTFAAKRLAHHQSVGSSKAVGAKVLRTTRKAFTRTVLPTSPSWMFGQVAESGFRAATSGAGPTSYLRGHRAMKALERNDPAAALRAKAIATPGGLNRVNKEISQKTLADEFEGTGLQKPARALTAMGGAPGVKQMRGHYNKFADFVFDQLNGKLIENNVQKAMLGRALRDSPLMDRHVVGLGRKAMDEAAEGLRGTETQVQLARQVQEMYGKYSAFSPGKREQIMHWTPFMPWMLNMTRFLTHTLPVEHPVMAGLLADTGVATEEWRRKHRLSLRAEGSGWAKSKDMVPPYLMGSYPAEELGLGKKGQYVRAGKFLPFAPASVLKPEELARQFLPQVSGPYEAAHGRNPITGDPKHGKYGKDVGAAEAWKDTVHEAVKSMVPVVGQLERINEDGAAKVLNPLAPTKLPKPKKKRGRKKKPGSQIPLGGGRGGTQIPLTGGGSSTLIPLN